MTIELSSERQQLTTVASELLDARAPLALARSFLEGAGDASALGTEIREMGWYAAGLEPEDPFGTTGLCLLAEQCGAHVAPIPLVDTAVAARLARSADSGSDALQALGAGAASASLAVLERRQGWDLTASAMTVREEGRTLVLNGEKLGVRHAMTVDILTVTAEIESGLCVVFVEPSWPGVTVEASPGLDAASSPCRVTFTDVRVPESHLSRRCADAIAAGFDVGAVMTAAEGLGAARRALELAIEYSRERRQFGRPIGSFQGLQHLMADAHVDREIAWATILAAAGALDDGSLDATQAVSMAKAIGSRASRTVVETALQVLGGIAFTWEHDVHLLQRRMLDCERRFGDAIHHEELQGTWLAERARGRG